MRILNLGCGTRTDPACVNIDFSPMLRLRTSVLGRRIAPWLMSAERRARYRELDTDLLVHDLRRGIPFPDASVDAVYHSHVLEHIDRQDVPAFLQEIHRVLRPGGVHRVVVPDWEALCRGYVAEVDATPETAAAIAPSAARRDAWIDEMIEQMVRREAAGTAQQRPVARWIENRVLGDARKRGQTHQWMYDGVTLRAALEAEGFDHVRTLDHRTSEIEEWDSIGLDREPDGSPYKPGSLYMEGRRPR